MNKLQEALAGRPPVIPILLTALTIGFILGKILIGGIILAIEILKH